MAGNGGPPDKWYTMKISPKFDSLAQTSTEILDCLNETYPITAAFTATCSDGTFVFLGVYNS
jgi:hypothetical protein